ncbi:Hypothetical_protein [Hexamita inflata]|uniref:Hypothetical_protein n=1 Tax=Hexamita inflata TaxID=28002 RepID=A0AA86PYM0_9EUKA|nr:Hypothetical protein HINF_LOCUS14558 [Hexamita inflata]CAI9926914.1 Hypothetical protein HINF_LOCUS14559 [Hexamita inflata]CAI9943827.1 Hypothetical protein HINF_LOCUS31472 [Hexamita inflata]CAI9948478.1 Hypothetical protein HINF_LOCUS36123 [Hexamita inflata]CAI9948479.1 Hypothetical protein HINF_LOCUS36124 [Hexamita inflata]
MAKINALNVKLTYTIIITLLFSVGLFFSFDVLLTSSQFLPDKVDTSKVLVKKLYNEAQRAEVHTKVTNFKLDKTQAYHHPQSTCLLDLMDTTYTTYYNLANNRAIEIYGAEDKQYHKVNCLSQYYIQHNQKQFISMYQASLACSIIGIVLPVSAIVLIWFFCIDWCKCKIQCGKKDEFTRIEGNNVEQERLI